MENEKAEEKVEVSQKKKGNGLFTIFACIMTGIIVFLATNLGQKASKIISPDVEKTHSKSNLLQNVKVELVSSSENGKEKAVVVATENGKEVWKYKTGEYDSTELDTFNMFEGKVYVYLVEAGKLKALDKNNGKEVWTCSTDVGRSAMLLEINDRLYVTSYYSSNLFTINAKDGNVEKTDKFEYSHPFDLKKTSDNIISFKAQNGSEEVTVEYDISTCLVSLVDF